MQSIDAQLVLVLVQDFWRLILIQPLRQSLLFVGLKHRHIAQVFVAISLGS